jgi:hypothetical protein
MVTNIWNILMRIVAVFAASVAVIISMRGRPATTEPTLPESAD